MNGKQRFVGHPEVSKDKRNIIMDNAGSKNPAVKKHAGPPQVFLAPPWGGGLGRARPRGALIKKGSGSLRSPANRPGTRRMPGVIAYFFGT